MCRIWLRWDVEITARSTSRGLLHPQRTPGRRLHGVSERRQLGVAFQDLAPRADGRRWLVFGDMHDRRRVLAVKRHGAATVLRLIAPFQPFSTVP